MSDPRLARLALLGVLLAALLPERMARAGPTLCPVRRLTGLPCPACGVTRSWNAAARLKLLDSLRFHPLGMPAMVATIVVGWRVGRGERVHLPAGVLSGITAAWLGVWLTRLLGGRR